MMTTQDKGGPSPPSGQMMNRIQETINTAWAAHGWDHVVAKECRHAEIMRAENMTKGGNEWKGHNMWKRETHTGARIILTNAEKRLMQIVDKESTHSVDGEQQERGKDRSVIQFEYNLEYMQQMQAAIMVIHVQEPGALAGCESRIKMLAEGKHMQAVIATGAHSKAAGMVIVMNNSWKRVRDPDQKLQTVQQNEDGEHRLMMLEFKAAHKVPGQPLQKLLLVAPYGYN